jgi:hypothetical protein
MSLQLKSTSISLQSGVLPFLTPPGIVPDAPTSSGTDSSGYASGSVVDGEVLGECMSADAADTEGLGYWLFRRVH